MPSPLGASGETHDWFLAGALLSINTATGGSQACPGLFTDHTDLDYSVVGEAPNLQMFICCSSSHTLVTAEVGQYGQASRAE